MSGHVYVSVVLTVCTIIYYNIQTCTHNNEYCKQTWTNVCTTT